MDGARRYHHRVAIVYQMFFLAIENEFGFTFLDAEELVDFSMDFVADLLAGLQTHHYQLGVFSGE